MRILNTLKIAKTGYNLISILFYIAAIACFLPLEVAPETFAIAGGAILIAYGIIKIIGYLSKDLYCLAFQYDFACGIFLIVLGIAAIIMRERADEKWFSGLGILILLDSLLSIQTSVDAKKFGLPTWAVILALSILSGTLGVVLIFFGTRTSAGCALLAEGLMRQYIVLCTVRLSSGTKPVNDN